MGRGQDPHPRQYSGRVAAQPAGEGFPVALEKHPGARSGRARLGSSRASRSFCRRPSCQSLAGEEPSLRSIAAAVGGNCALPLEHRPTARTLDVRRNARKIGLEASSRITARAAWLPSRMRCRAPGPRARRPAIAEEERHEAAFARGAPPRGEAQRRGHATVDRDTSIDGECSCGRLRTLVSLRTPKLGVSSRRRAPSSDRTVLPGAIQVKGGEAFRPGGVVIGPGRADPCEPFVSRRSRR